VQLIIGLNTDKNKEVAAYIKLGSRDRENHFQTVQKEVTPNQRPEWQDLLSAGKTYQCD
jgi:hypothetical protein